MHEGKLSCIYLPSRSYKFVAVSWSDNLKGMDYIDTKAKCHLKKLTCKGTLRQVVICLRRPRLLGFFGWSSNFVASESGQRVLNYCRIWSPTGLNTPHPLPATHCTLTHRTREKVRGAPVHKAGWKIPTSDCTSILQSKNCRKVPLQVYFYR
jgi:hypothetical protein